MSKAIDCNPISERCEERDSKPRSILEFIMFGEADFDPELDEFNNNIAARD